MRDGLTRRIQPMRRPDLKSFLDRFRASLVVVAGDNAGKAYALNQKELVLGRGAEATIRIEDEALSRRHALFEVYGDGFRVTDLSSTNGVFVNGERVAEANLKHGDRVDLGSQKCKYVVEEIKKKPQVYVVSE
jgi:pSer/pThr/pTyr-binding forkhead associated (FHA) protein